MSNLFNIVVIFMQTKTCHLHSITIPFEVLPIPFPLFYCGKLCKLHEKYREDPRVFSSPKIDLHSHA